MNSFSFYDLNEEGHQEGLLTQSKHIKKADKKQYIDDEKCNIAANQSSNGRKGAKYDTFNSEEKEDIYEMLKAQEDNLNEILSYKAPKYRELLKTIIPKFRADFNSADKAQMTQMWKKVKGLIASKVNNKSEKRGEPIILDEELPEFRLRIKAIIKTLKNKNFEAFRKKLLLVIKEIRTRGGRAFDPNVFKKHKWSEFVNDEANAEIRRLWKNLRRSSNKNSDEVEEETTSSYESGETMASEADYYENMNASPLTSSVESTQAMECAESVSEAESSGEDDFGCVIEIPNVSDFVSSVQSYQGVDDYLTFEDSNAGPVEQQCYMEAPQTPSFCGFSMGSFGAREKFIKESEEDVYQKEVFAGFSSGNFSWESMFKF